MPSQWEPTGEKLPTGEIPIDSMLVPPEVAQKREAAFAARRSAVLGKDEELREAARTVRGMASRCRRAHALSLPFPVAAFRGTLTAAPPPGERGEDPELAGRWRGQHHRPGAVGPTALRRPRGQARGEPSSHRLPCNPESLPTRPVARTRAG